MIKNRQIFKLIKSQWLSNTVEILHHCEGCSQLMGWISITNRPTVARYSNQIEFPASDLLDMPQIRPARDNRALISHSGPAEPQHSPRTSALPRHTLTTTLLEGSDSYRQTTALTNDRKFSASQAVAH